MTTSAKSEKVLKEARRNKELAVEIYCELYIYSNYSADEVGEDCKSHNYEIYSGSETCGSWLCNLIYRLNSIFRRRGVCVTVDMEDVKDLLVHKDELAVI